MNTIDTEKRMEKISIELSDYKKISLEEMNESSLMSRYDQKYIFPLSKLVGFIAALKNEYKVLSINDKVIASYENIYFDTPELKSYHDHHNKRGIRHKIRIRKYSDSGDCFLEVKSKNNKGTTDKKRMPVANLSDSLDKDQFKFLSGLADDQTLNLHTSLKNEFQRITLVSEESHERVTIDFAIRFHNDGKEKKLSETVVAEVKQEQHFHKSGFKQLMQDERIFPASFSKYCMGTLLTHTGIKYNRFKSKLLTLNKINDGVA